ncbi:hypothetical protein EFQ32_07265 [Limosilactobacillus fermentum]|nr:hypothetical protein [Limosilactobacillus fermentum]MCT3440860.1 hypothetical protein [Limosilactobacillus fermentum]
MKAFCKYSVKLWLNYAKTPLPKGFVAAHSFKYYFKYYIKEFIIKVLNRFTLAPIVNWSKKEPGKLLFPPDPY